MGIAELNKKINSSTAAMPSKMGFFPDGTKIDAWFSDTSVPSLDALGTQYIVPLSLADKDSVFADYYSGGCELNNKSSIKSDTLTQGKRSHFITIRERTNSIQNLIDQISKNGGGVLVVPAANFTIGSIFLKKGVNLYLMKGAMLRGSEDISDYPLCETRIEGETCEYFPALVNADGCDGLVIAGEGSIDGNGLHAWRAFWTRLKWNPSATNKDEQRPRLVYISNSSNVTISGVLMENSCFWTSHIYKCDHVRYIGARFYAPREPIPAPSSDAIDIDACHDVLISGCEFQVNDDAVVLKGGKGRTADLDPNNGSNERVIVEKSNFTNTHGLLTCGSESIHDRNVIVRDCHFEGLYNMLWLKMRPDTPQIYEYILVENVSGACDNFVFVNKWNQFANLAAGTLLSFGRNVTMRDCQVDCKTLLNIKRSDDQYELADFAFEGIQYHADDFGYEDGAVEGYIFR